MENRLPHIDKLRTWCSRGEKCVHEVYQWCQRRGIDKEVARQIARQLVCEGFVDHSRYVRAFVNDKLRLNGWGMAKIRYALKAKHIEEDRINQALAEADTGEEERNLCRFVEKKAQQLLSKKLEPFMVKQKLLQYCLSRGYNYEMAERVITGWLRVELKESRDSNF